MPSIRRTADTFAAFVGKPVSTYVAPVADKVVTNTNTLETVYGDVSKTVASVGDTVAGAASLNGLKNAACWTMKNGAKIGLSGAQGVYWVAEKALKGSEVTMAVAKKVLQLARVALEATNVGLEGAKLALKGALAAVAFMANGALGGLFDVKKLGFHMELGAMENSVCAMAQLTILGKPRTVDFQLDLSSVGKAVKSLARLALAKDNSLPACENRLRSKACDDRRVTTGFEAPDNSNAFPWIDSNKIALASATLTRAVDRRKTAAAAVHEATSKQTEAIARMNAVSAANGIDEGECVSFNTPSDDKWYRAPSGFVMALSGFVRVTVDAEKDATLALVTKDVKDHEQAYRITFGAETNSQVILARGSSPKVMKRAVSLRKGQHEKFWISVSAGQVSLGLGAHSGAKTMLQWFDPSPLEIHDIQAKSALNSGGAKWKVCPAADCVKKDTTLSDKFVALTNLYMESTKAVVVRVRASQGYLRIGSSATRFHEIFLSGAKGVASYVSRDSKAVTFTKSESRFVLWNACGQKSVNCGPTSTYAACYERAIAACDEENCVAFTVKKLGGNVFLTYSDRNCVRENGNSDRHWDLYVQPALASYSGAALVNRQAFRTFWVTFKDGVIRVGGGSEANADRRGGALQLRSGKQCMVSSGANVVQGACGRHKEAVWVFYPGSGQVRNKAGRCFSANDTERRTKGGQVHASPCEPNNSDQQFQYDPEGYQLRHQHGLCLQQSGSGATFQPCNLQSGSQQWSVYVSSQLFEAISEDLGAAYVALKTDKGPGSWTVCPAQS